MPAGVQAKDLGGLRKPRGIIPDPCGGSGKRVRSERDSGRPLVAGSELKAEPQHAIPLPQQPVPQVPATDPPEASRLALHSSASGGIEAAEASPSDCAMDVLVIAALSWAWPAWASATAGTSCTAIVRSAAQITCKTCRRKLMNDHPWTLLPVAADHCGQRSARLTTCMSSSILRR